MPDLPKYVRGCARCGADEHEVRRWHVFRQPVPDADGDFTHWATCPVTGDPILLRFTDRDLVLRPGRIAIGGHQLRDGRWERMRGADVGKLLREPPTSADAGHAYVDPAEVR